MGLVLPIYNGHPYSSLKTLGKKVCIMHGKIWQLQLSAFEICLCICVCTYIHTYIHPIKYGR